MTDKARKELEFCGIDKYHELGYKGKGIVIFNYELDEKGEHGEMTTDVLQLVAPEATIINARESFKSWDGITFNMFNGEKLSPMEMYNMYKPDIISVSFSGQSEIKNIQMQELVDLGVVIFNSAGNEGSDGVTGRYEGVGLLVGAAQFTGAGTLQIAGFSGYDKDEMSVALAGFMGDGSGTSAACPFVAAQAALLMQKYGKMTQAEFMSFIEGKTYDVNADGDDIKSGKGIIIMPTNNPFTDVEPTRWSADAIEWCRLRGLMVGISETEFNPTGIVTREQMAQILKTFYGELAYGS